MEQVDLYRPKIYIMNNQMDILSHIKGFDWHGGNIEKKLGETWSYPY